LLARVQDLEGALMLQDGLTLASGAVVGFILGLVGGGGSILAVPLLVYVVGVASPHVAIGTSAIAVSLSALASLVGHARAHNVRWPCALMFAGFGSVGAAVGSTLGKRVDGQQLLSLFGILMLIVAATMLRQRRGDGAGFVPLSKDNAPTLGIRLIAYGTGIGVLSGFFGIGGGFLVVPGLIAAADLPLIAAIGSSLVSVAAFGLTTAANYAVSNLIDWHIVALFVIGGVVGSLFGTRMAVRLAPRKQALSHVFAGIVAIVGVYVVVRGLMA
jgi:uncharacterized protein